ncbi:MAG: S8 family serine peptidase [Amaricoccus sp.]|uniref:S8 family serine peptidase n=1 Tax=Amaricoccus sp. TaxID=1872485 RepID=UPI0039E3D74A
MARKRRPAPVPPSPRLPRLVFAQASPHSIGGRSLFDADSGPDATTVDDFRSEARIYDRAVDELRRAGFTVLRADPERLSVNFAGPPSLFAAAFGAPLFAEEREVIKPGQVHTTATFLDCRNARRRGLVATARSRFGQAIEGVAIEAPRFLMGRPSAVAPTVDYWHLDVPDGVALASRATLAHRAGITGRGIRVAMVDTGHQAHPFFERHGYRVAPVVLGPGATDPARDTDGHGTAESANIFAVAPDVELLPVKMSTVNTAAAFNVAVSLRPHVISLSWGGNLKPPATLEAPDLTLAAAIAAAVRAGIVVVVSSGNGEFGFPGMHPDVISAGGVFMNRDGRLRASDYSSGFDAGYVYPHRHVPDLCGLVGQLPKAAYILLPMPKGCRIDDIRGGGRHPYADQTGSHDGWAAMSGTSAAAPQLAGAAALLLQACPSLTPHDVRAILVGTARDVHRGRCHPNQDNKARRGRDLATGAGLVDAGRAVMVAKFRGLGSPGSPPLTPGEAARLADMLSGPGS